MTTTLNSRIAIEIRPWQSVLYNQMGKPDDLKAVGRKIRKMGRDLGALQAAGDTDAVGGATIALCLLLLEAASLTLSAPEERETRTQLLQTWSKLWKADPLLRIVLESTMARAQA